jgi:hypothetical protein
MLSRHKHPVSVGGCAKNQLIQLPLELNESELRKCLQPLGKLASVREQKHPRLVSSRVASSTVPGEYASAMRCKMSTDWSHHSSSVIQFRHSSAVLWN